jgi:predicted  nucleic acid-binding Zn-ribbon protein
MLTDTLRKCHHLRRHLRDLQAEIDRGPRVLQGQRDTLEGARAAHAAHHEAITQLKVKQRTDEATLKETETRLRKLEGQLLTISVPKEVAAKESEIAQAKAKQGELEDAILATIMEIEQKTGEIPAVEKAWADAQAAFAEFERDAAERLERLKNDQLGSRDALAAAEAELPEEPRAKYNSQVKAHGPDALAGVKNKVCQGCRRGLTDQKWTEVRSGALMTCPNCGKLLYPVVE